MTVSAALAQALAAARPVFNARVAAARAAQPGFDVGALAAVLRDQLDPIAQAVQAVAPERVADVVAAGFDMAVVLVGQRLIGQSARHPLVNRLWAEVAPLYAAPIAARPTASLGSLTNAVLRLAATAGVRVEQWLVLMMAVAPLVDVDTLKPAGQIAAWRSGMAHYRQGALAAADALPEALALAAVGTSGSWRETRVAFEANPWWSPQGVVEGASFGGFTGFGGPFAEPPAVAACGDGFLVRSGDRTGLLVADAFGATLHSATPEQFDAAMHAGEGRLRLNGASIQAGDRTIVSSWPGEGLSAVANAHSIAIASPFSHHVSLHPWRLS